MANKPKGFGLTAEIAKRIADSFDPEQASELFEYMIAVLEYGNVDGKFTSIIKKLPLQVEKIKDVQDALSDGLVICHVLNVMFPGTIKKVGNGTAPFQKMERISNFVDGCEAIGCKKVDLFTTADLYEGGNIPQVVNGLAAMARKSHHVPGDIPTYGPVESSGNKREFTQEQLKAGEHIIGLQAGSNKGASQKGMNFGKTRAIID